MRTAAILAMVLAGLVATIGLLGMVAPLLLLEFARSLLMPSAIYFVAAVRIAFGALLLWVAPASRMPRTLRVLGVVILVVGLVTPLFGVERAQAVLAWWSGRGELFMRAFPALAIVFGVFIIYVLASPRRADA